MHFCLTLFFRAILMGMSLINTYSDNHICMLCRPEQFNQSFPILVVQINAFERVNLSENDTVSLRFDLSEVAIYLL